MKMQIRQFFLSTILANLEKWMLGAFYTHQMGLLSNKARPMMGEINSPAEFQFGLASRFVYYKEMDHASTS
jgi:hypothetical protein